MCLEVRMLEKHLTSIILTIIINALESKIILINLIENFGEKKLKKIKNGIPISLSLSSGAESKRHQPQRQHYCQYFQMAAASSIVRGSRSCFQF